MSGWIEIASSAGAVHAVLTFHRRMAEMAVALESEEARRLYWQTCREVMQGIH